MTNVIEIKDLSRQFGDFTAVNSVNLNVPRGQIFGFLGPNGSGKTTTIRMLLRLLPPTSGTAYLFGQDIRQAGRNILRRIGYMSQKFSLYSDLTVMENVRFFGRSYGLSGRQLRERQDFVLDLAGLHAHKNTRTADLSGGWAQRLALGTAILHKPDLVFLDEPTAGVDPISRRQFWELLYELADGGTTIFVTTHYMDEAEHCENLAFIYYGKIIAQGSPQAIVEQNIAGEVIAFEPGNPSAVMAELKAAIAQGELPAHNVSLFGASIHVITEAVAPTRDYLSARYSQAMREHYLAPPSLEDAFIELVRRH